MNRWNAWGTVLVIAATACSLATAAPTCQNYEQYRQALRTIDMLLIVQPDAIWELRERGMLYYRTGVFVLALADLRRYLKLAPDHEESDLLKYYVDLLKRLVVSNN